jgi:hypothetical protein
VEALAETGKSGSYDAAADLLTDLRVLAERNGGAAEFDQRIAGMRDRYRRRPAFLRRHHAERGDQEAAEILAILKAQGQTDGEHR